MKGRDGPAGLTPIGPSEDPGEGHVPPDSPDHRTALQVILRRNALTTDQLWLGYFALGGDVGPVELEAYLQGLMPLTSPQRDILAQAANEFLDEVAGRLRVPYSRPLRDPLPSTGPLTALVQLMKDTPRLLSGDLATAAEEAARALGPGVSLVIYLIDAHLRQLVPFGSVREGPVPGRPSVNVDGSLPGRAFSSSTIQVSRAGDHPRLYVPLLDGMDRLGVLDVGVPADSINDPFLREQCGWFARLLAHLISAAASTGDAVVRARRPEPAGTSAELIWAMLPPLTAGSDSFTLSCLLEPALTVGGDAFDYALGARTVHVAIFDAMGHELGAGLIACAALSAGRAARRAGHGLAAQADAIDLAISAHFPEAFATGVLGELDLETGRLRYLVAGHPAPLVLRNGKVVASLEEGRRVPFGLGNGEIAVGESTLEPSDWLVLYTDGVTEARDVDGSFFGHDRLVDFLERAAGSSQPPAETVRRLMRSVLDHQKSVLQDDATVLLASWQPPVLGMLRA